jgi:hypothetical protein
MNAQCCSIIAVVWSIALMPPATTAYAAQTYTVRVKLMDDAQKDHPILESKITIGGNALHFEKASADTRIIGSMGNIRNGELPLAIKITKEGKIGTNAVPTSVIHQESFDVRTLIQIGSAQRIDCGGSRWLELQLD